MIKITNLFLIIVLITSACNSASQANQITDFEVYENKKIVPSVYWYFDIERGDRTVFKVETSTEQIFFEVAGTTDQFNFSGKNLAAAKVKIITKDNRCFLGQEGYLKGQLENDHLELDINLKCLSPKNNIQAESILIGKEERRSYDVLLKDSVRKLTITKEKK